MYDICKIQSRLLNNNGLILFFFSINKISQEITLYRKQSDEEPSHSTHSVMGSVMKSCGSPSKMLKCINLVKVEGMRN